MHCFRWRAETAETPNHRQSEVGTSGVGGAVCVGVPDSLGTMLEISSVLAQIAAALACLPMAPIRVKSPKLSAPTVACASCCLSPCRVCVPAEVLTRVVCIVRGSCYPLRIPENSDEAVVHHVVASDADTGINGQITYSITGQSTLRADTSFIPRR